MTQSTLRRSVTIGSNLNTRIHEFRSIAGQHGIELDYTKTLNLFAELGSRWLEDSIQSDRAKQHEIFDRYLEYEKMEDGIISDWKEFEEFREWKERKRSSDQLKAR